MNSQPNADSFETTVGPKAPQTIARLLNKTVYAALLVLLCLATIAYGGADPWLKVTFATFMIAISLLAVVEITLSNYPKLTGTQILLPVLVLIIFALLQSVSFSSSGLRDSGIQAPFWNSLSADPYESRVFALQLFALLLLAGMLFRYATSKRRLRLLIHVIIVLSLASAVFGMLRQTMQHGPGFGLPLLVADVGYGQFINKNHFAFLMEMGLGLALGLLAAGGVRRDRALVYLAVSLPMWTALVLSNSRGGLLAMLVQLIVTLLLFPTVVRTDHLRASKAWRLITSPVFRIGLVTTLLVLCVMGIFWVGGDRLASNIEAAQLEFAKTDESRVGVTRTQIWRDTLQLIKANPIAGVGMGGYWAAIPLYHDAAGTMTPQQAHNDYLELLASGGVIALAIFLWFVVLVFREARTNLRSPDAFRRAASFAGLIAIAGVAVHSLLDFGLHRMGNAMIFVALIVIVTGQISNESGTSKNAGR